MPKARFIADCDPASVCTVLGRDFAPGDWVDVTDMEANDIARLAGNPTFEMDYSAEIAAAAEAEAAAVAAEQAAADAAAKADAKAAKAAQKAADDAQAAADAAAANATDPVP